MRHKTRLPQHVRPQFYADGFVVPYQNISVADYHRDLGSTLMSDLVGEHVDSSAIVMATVQHWQKMAKQVRHLSAGRSGQRMAQIASKAVMMAFIDAETERRVEAEELQGKTVQLSSEDLDQKTWGLYQAIRHDIDDYVSKGDFPDYSTWRRNSIESGDKPEIIRSIKAQIGELGERYFPGMATWSGPDDQSDDSLNSVGIEFQPVAMMVHNMVQVEIRDRGDGLEVWIGEPEHLSNWSGESIEDQDELTNVALLDDLGVDISTLSSIRMATGALLARFRAYLESDGFDVEHKDKAWNLDSRSLNVVMHHSIYATPEWPRGRGVENEKPIEDFLNQMDDIVANIWHEAKLSLDEDRVMELKSETLREVGLYPLYGRGAEHVIDMATGQPIARVLDSENSEDLEVVLERLWREGKIPSSAVMDELEGAQEYVAQSSCYYFGHRPLQDVMRDIRRWEAEARAPSQSGIRGFQEVDDDALLSDANSSHVPPPPEM